MNVRFVSLADDSRKEADEGQLSHRSMTASKGLNKGRCSTGARDGPNEVCVDVVSRRSTAFLTR